MSYDVHTMTGFLHCPVLSSPKIRVTTRQLGASCQALVRQRLTSAEEDALKRLNYLLSTLCP